MSLSFCLSGFSASSLEVWVTPYHPQWRSEPFRSHQWGSGDSTGRGYEWLAWSKLWQVWLWPDAAFLAPSLLLREEGRSTSRVQPSGDLANCFLRGIIVGHEHSSDVAINACDGLVSTHQCHKLYNRFQQ